MSFGKKAIFFTARLSEQMFRIFCVESRSIFRSSFVCRDKSYLESPRANASEDISVLAVKNSSAGMLNFCVNGR